MSTPRKDPPEKDRDEKPKEAKKPKDDKEKDEKPPKEHKGKAHKSKKDKGKAEKPKDDEGRGEKPIEVQERAEKPIEVKEGAEKPKKKDEKPKEDEKPTGVKEQTEKPQDDRDRDEKPKHDKEKMEKPKGDKPKVSKEKAGKSKDSKEHVEKPKDHKEKGEKSKDDKDKGARPKDDKDKGARPKDDKDKGARPKDDKDKGARPKDDKEQGDKGKKKGRRESLKSHMARKKKEMQDNPEPGPSGCNLVDPYANSTASNYITRGRTGIVYDTEVLKHKCEWDDKYPENPQRLSAIMEKCYEKGLLARCHQIKNYLRADLYEKILLVHSKEHYDKLKSLSQCANLAMMECEASEYDSVYFNRFTFDATCRALSSVLNLVDAVAKRDVQNGMAFVRPPGHHAMHHEYNGYCFFNNVAVAAESCIKDGHASRILIVDIDVHHGQGTQRQFYDRKDVLYFSIHRYQHGTFWPNLLESNFNYIGKGEGLGYNINVPLNSTGLTDDDYLAIVFSILLPVGYEFNPNLVIVSAGYDAALGCPEFNPQLVIVSAGYDACLGDEKGKMNVTPGFYAHLISHLSTLARGQIAVVLEGGYFLPTLSEGASLTLKALLGGPCPILDPIKNVHPSVVETICNVRRSLYNKWNCFKICELIPPTEVPTDSDEHQYQISYFGEVDKAPYPTRRCYPENSIPEHNFYTRLNKALKEKYRGSIDLPVYYVYDDQMLQHCPQRGDIERPERPERLTSIMNLFHEFGVDQRLMRTPIIRRDFTSWSPHSRHYFSTVNIAMKQTKDVYVNEYTHDSVLLAVCGLLNLIDAIMNGEARAGVAVVRPPGHHAEHNKPLGFCFINNIAVAANYVHLKYNIQRILIVDFDIHHGNGTQNMFYQSSNVMYISIHKDEEGKFFPANSPRTCKHDGYACGKGFNINIPFNKDKMGDTEYLAAFHNIILPAAYAFAPQIVLVSAGFDAGIHDPLGGYSVNPETFGHFIQMLKPLAEGRLILSLEGGYNLTTTSYAMTICTKVLLGDPVMMPKNVFKTFSDEAVKTIREVTNHFKKYYNIFHINKPLGTTPSLVKKVRRFTQESYAMELVKVLDVDRVDDNEYVENEMRSLNDSRQSLV